MLILVLFIYFTPSGGDHILLNDKIWKKRFLSPTSALPSGRIPQSSFGFNQTWRLASLKQADHIFSYFRLA
jgi:hypothetical protein